MFNIKKWIKSWFDEVEDGFQYNHSLALFRSYYQSVQNSVDDHYSGVIDDIVENITRNI